MTERSPDKDKLLHRLVFRKRWWQHILFWMAAYAFLAAIFTPNGWPEKIDLVYTAIFIIPLILMACLNLYVAIPLLLRKERYLLYILVCFLLIWLTALVLYHLFDSWIDHILPGYYFIAYLGVNNLLIYSASAWLITTLLKLSRSWFLVLRMEKEQSGAELTSLKAQVNPHFLLNSLHTIYGLALKKSDETPGVILRLSDILKYTLYESEKDRVKLEDEIRIIREYLDIQRQRTDPERVHLRFDVTGKPDGITVAPMLFLPFIENSFKHGVQGEEGKVDVHIEMEIKRKILLFRISNTAPVISGEEMNDRGIGISNTRKRLELLYPGRHDFRIQKMPSIFIVEIKLQTS